MTYGTQTKYPVKAMGDLEKVTAFTALYLRQCLTIDFDKRDYYNRKH
jgi:hypothetical protein